MNLLEAVTKIDQCSDGSVIVAKRPFSWGAAARIVELEDEGRVPSLVLADGYEYLLEKDGVLRLLSLAAAKRMSERTKVEFIVHYAEMDAYPAWFEDLPDA